MLFALICTDKPNSLDLRLKVRPEHLQFLEALGTSMKGAGPFLSEFGQLNGSLVIIAAEDSASAKLIAASDPYANAGLFASVEIRPWKSLIKNPEA